MDNSFVLQVDHAGAEKTFTAELQPFGYTYRIAVAVNDTTIYFEPDEEGSYRALLIGAEDRRFADTALIKAIALRLEEAFR